MTDDSDQNRRTARVKITPARIAHIKRLVLNGQLDAARAAEICKSGGVSDADWAAVNQAAPATSQRKVAATPHEDAGQGGRSRNAPQIASVPEPEVRERWSVKAVYGLVLLAVPVVWVIAGLVVLAIKLGDEPIHLSTIEVVLAAPLVFAVTVCFFYVLNEWTKGRWR